MSLARTEPLSSVLLHRRPGTAQEAARRATAVPPAAQRAAGRPAEASLLGRPAAHRAHPGPPLPEVVQGDAPPAWNPAAVLRYLAKLCSRQQGLSAQLRAWHALSRHNYGARANQNSVDGVQGERRSARFKFLGSLTGSLAAIGCAAVGGWMQARPASVARWGRAFEVAGQAINQTNQVFLDWLDQQLHCLGGKAVANQARLQKETLDHLRDIAQGNEALWQGGGEATKQIFRQLEESIGRLIEQDYQNRMSINQKI